MKLKYKLETKFTPPTTNQIHKFKIDSIAKVIKPTGWVSIRKGDTVKVLLRDRMAICAEVIKGSRKGNTLWLLPDELKLIKEG